MNRRRKIKQMKKFITKNGIIENEYKRPKDEYYRKGSYVVTFDSEKYDMFCYVSSKDKYHAYKSIIKIIKEKVPVEQGLI